MKELTQIAEKLLKCAREAGADSAQCVVALSEKREFNVDGGAFSLMRTLFDAQLRLSVLMGHRQGSISLNRLDDEALAQAAKSAVESAEGSEPDEAREFAPGPLERSFTDGAIRCDTEKLFMRTRELMEDIGNKHPKIVVEQMIVDHENTRSVYQNTNGVRYERQAGRYQLELMYSGHEGEKSTSFFGSSVALADLDTPFIECGFVDRELGDVENQLDPIALKGKFTGTALYAPSCLAWDIFGTVLENMTGDVSLLEGTSIWKDRLGQQVADERITLRLAPADERIVCGQRYTSEGYPAQDMDVIRNGRLEAFTLSQYAANKLGGRRAGNDSGALIVEAGKTPLAEIIRGIDKGVLIGRFSGGEPASSGEFSGVAKNSFLIENGRIAGALSETMISGNIADMLKNVRAVSSEVLNDGAMSMPYMAFDGVVVSGR